MVHKKSIHSTVCFKDYEIASKILESCKPPQMKSLGRKVKNFDDAIWDQQCFDIVKTGNRHKVSLAFGDLYLCPKS